MKDDLTLRVPKKELDKFRLHAIKHFPLEVYGLLLCRRVNDSFTLYRIEICPDDQLENSDEHVQPTSTWIEKVASDAHAEGGEVYGDIHSHCYELEKARKLSTEPSEADWAGIQRYKDLFLPFYEFCGVICVHKVKEKYTTKTTFWPRIPKVKTIIR